MYEFKLTECKKINHDNIYICTYMKYLPQNHHKGPVHPFRPMHSDQMHSRFTFLSQQLLKRVTVH